MHYSRRQLLATPAVALLGCRPERGNGYEGHAFVANEEGQAIAAVNLTAFAVTRHIRIDGRPSQVIAHSVESAVWALTPATGTIHEIDPARLSLRRKVTVCGRAAQMALSTDGAFLWVLAREPRRLLQLDLKTLKPVAELNLPADPLSLHLVSREPWAAVLFHDAPPRLVNTSSIRETIPIKLDYAPTLAHFRLDGRQLLTANGLGRQVSLITVPEGRLITHLPLAIEPKHLEAKPDGGQIFLTGDGLDAVVIVYPYRGEVAETVLAGRHPGAMAAVSTSEVDFLFTANPDAGNVTILDLTTHRMIGAVSVGRDPSFLTITPDKQYALVLNRSSGDMAVIRIKAITRNKNKSAPLFTMIPVGSRPVAAAVRSV